MRIQLCPALMDWIVFLILFAVLYSAGERGLTGGQKAWLGAISMVTYTVTSLLVGLVLTRGNARALLIWSTLLTTILGAVCLIVVHFQVQMVILGLLGVTLATFFNSFQTFMRGETIPGGLALTGARYTFAWSGGSSLGFLSSGFVYPLGPVALAGVNVVVGLTVLWILLRHRPRDRAEAGADDHEAASVAGGSRVDPRFVYAAWCIIFATAVMQRPLQSLFPAACGRIGISSTWAGSVLFLHMLIQGIWGHRMVHFERWQYRRLPLIIAHLAASLVLGWMAWWNTFAVTALGIIVLGFFTGFAFFSAVFYSSNSGHRSWNIGVNECLVGLGCLVGLFVSERWIAYVDNDAAMYVAGAIALLGSLVLQLGLTSVPRRRAATDTLPATPPNPA